jgi:KaiC.
MSNENHKDYNNGKITIEKRGSNEQDLIKLTHDKHHETVGYADNHRWKLKNVPQNPSTLQTRILAQLQSFFVEWSPRKSTSKPTERIPLASSSMFSPAFNNALSTANTANISGLDDDLTMEVFFKALLEWEASYQFRSGRNGHLQKLLNINTGTDRDAVRVSGDLEIDGELRWSINNGKINGTTWTKLIGLVLGSSRMDSLATLANILNMSFENLYQYSSERRTAKSHFTLQEPAERIPQKLYVPELSLGLPCIKLIEQADIYGTARPKIGSILHYQMNGTDFCLPATVGDGVLCMGKYKPAAHFLNQYLMDQHPHAPVILCQDMRTALKLQHLLEETRGHNPAETIVTAHLGTDLSVLPWSYFHGHHVVFVPAPTKESMAAVKLYRDHITGAHARSFQVFCGFLLHSQPNCDQNGHVEGITDAEDELLRKSVWLDAVERPLLLAQQVIKEAVSYDGYISWGRTLGIFKAPRAHDRPEVTPPKDELVLFAPSVVNVTQQPMSITDVTVQHILPPQRNVLLHGLKDTGKSFVCLAITKAVISGNALFGCIPSTGGGNVMYINSETPKEDFIQRLAQVGLADEISQHLFVLSKYDHMATDCAFLLTEPLFCNKVTTLLKKTNCRYIILDNLTTLMQEGQATQTIAINKVYDWIEKLQQRGICVVVVHHTLDNGNAGTMLAKARGSADTSNRNHGELVLIGSTQILEKKMGTEAVQHAAAQDGLTMGVHFKVCKAACVLQKKTLWLHLPLGASEWKFLAITGADGKEIEFPMNSITTGVKTAPGEECPSPIPDIALTAPTEHNLSPDQRAWSSPHFDRTPL